MNPPPQQHPQIYGAFGTPDLGNIAQNGGQWAQGEDYSYEDGDGDGNGDNDVDGGDNRDAKRRRIARACDMCRKKKIKCDGKLPACTHCINYKTDCVFTQVEKKRSPPKG